MVTRSSHGWFAALLVAVVAGCGDSVPFEFAPVQGKITYADGSPIDAATVRVHFIPQNVQPVGSKYPRPASGELSRDGTFSAVSTATRNDGAIPGRHKVVLEASNADFTPRPQAVAARYCDPAQSPLVVDVTPDGENHFELKVERGP